MPMKKENKKAPMPLGLYIHVPFCRRKCFYCDFCSFPAQKGEVIEAYVGELCREITARGAACGGYLADTVYIGGGTPSLLSGEQIKRVLDALRGAFSIAEDAEITLECNPMTRGDESEEYFSVLRSLGVNRLSIGAQSANDNELKLLGRGHGFEQTRATYFAARRAGFENISLDLMLAIPSQTQASLASSIDALTELYPEHISIYSLQLEEGTPLFRMRERYELPDDDAAADMYELTVRKMKEAGYAHYEISNFARAGRESRHNCKYWTLGEYAGLGPSAHSDLFGKRLENTDSLSEYMSGKWQKGEREIGKAERLEEYIMLGLRTSRGIIADECRSAFGEGAFEAYAEKLAKYCDAHLVELDGRGARLTERGFEVSNAILSEILELYY